jgi:CDP-diacylglycerol--glycerol-3-phosphate 3-phosphatidyltransferase
LIPSCKVGFLERPERIVLVIIGALFNRMAPVLWVIAVLSTITVIHRMWYTYQQMKPITERELQTQAAAAQAKNEPTPNLNRPSPLKPAF